MVEPLGESWGKKEEGGKEGGREGRERGTLLVSAV